MTLNLELRKSSQLFVHQLLSNHRYIRRARNFRKTLKKDTSPMSKFKSPESLGAPKAGKQIKNFQ